MFIAKAKHWVNYNGVWHPKGDEFPIDDADIAGMQKHAVILQEQNKQETQEAAEPAKRGRKRKE